MSSDHSHTLTLNHKTQLLQLEERLEAHVLIQRPRSCDYSKCALGLVLLFALLIANAAEAQERAVDAWKCVDHTSILESDPIDRKPTWNLLTAVDSIVALRGIACPWVSVRGAASFFAALRAYDAGWRAVVNESRRYQIHLVVAGGVAVAVLTYLDQIEEQGLLPGQDTYLLYVGTDPSAKAIVDALDDVAPIKRTGLKGLGQP